MPQSYLRHHMTLRNRQKEPAIRQMPQQWDSLGGGHQGPLGAAPASLTWLVTAQVCSLCD